MYSLLHKDNTGRARLRMNQGTLTQTINFVPHTVSF